MEQWSGGNEPTKLETGGEKLGFTADHHDNRRHQTHYFAQKIGAVTRGIEGQLPRGCKPKGGDTAGEASAY